MHSENYKCNQMHNSFKIFFLAIFLCLGFIFASCQDLDYLVPILSRNANRDSSTSLILTTGNDAWAEGIPQKKPYINSVQIIDADQPWPPRWYSATAVYTADMFRRDTLAGVSRFDWILDAQIVSGYFSYYKLLSRPLMKDGPLQNVELAAYMLLNNKMQCVDTIKTERGIENMFYRSLSMNAKGERLIGLKKDTHLNLTGYTHNVADSAIHCEIDILEVLDAKGKLLFYWNPMDHLDPKLFRFKESLTGRAYGYARTDIIQWTRLTNAQWDADGNIIYSLLLYGVGKISRDDGHIIWQINSNQMPMIKGNDTLQWYRQHDFKFLYETDSFSVYSLYSNGLKDRLGHDSILACGVVFELNKKTEEVRLLKYKYPKINIVPGGQGGYDIDMHSGNYLISYGNLKKAISPNAEFTENLEYGNRDSVYGIYLMPQNIHCFKAHRLTNFDRPPRPMIIKNGDELEATGDISEFTWYRMSGDHNTKIEKAGSGRKLKFENSATYCVARKYGVGYCVSLPFTTDEGFPYYPILLSVLGFLFISVIGLKAYHSPDSKA
jgi:hypothetical protein